MELNSGGSAAQWNGEFYTPRDVSYFMAKMMLGDAEIPGDRPLTLSEPACGSGGMVLAFAEALGERGIAPNRVWVEARDASRHACDMAYVNLTLCGIPAVVIHGNTLTMQEHARWRTPWRTAFEPPPLDEAMRMVMAVEEGRRFADGERDEGPDEEGPDRDGGGERTPAELGKPVEHGPSGRRQAARPVPREAAGSPAKDEMKLF